ncbi:unnamed protein product [Ceratitis capitata]|uniref:(Mediterranean fruit fly) hypothetical protein n=1 Tax=Ceratitis capitata TaxID=7213 RepID=A0A811V127_CERCA|nr:unnamed protein product [Ceratitis capitata]
MTATTTRVRRNELKRNESEILRIKQLTEEEVRDKVQHIFRRGAKQAAEYELEICIESNWCKQPCNRSLARTCTGGLTNYSMLHSTLPAAPRASPSSESLSLRKLSSANFSVNKAQTKKKHIHIDVMKEMKGVKRK